MFPTLTDVQTLARQAGEILRDGYESIHEIGYKGPVDLVTEMDQRSEDFLIGTIRSKFPDDQIVSEESGKLSGVSANRWFLDPLDGTVNYAHKVPIFCVSIGYADAQGLRLGAVYDPSRDECFSAERGKGAWLNDDPIHVSATEDILHCLLVTGFPADTWKKPRNNLEYFGRLTRLSQGVRRLGSAALDISYVASGRFDGYWEEKSNPWDMAAGALIALEAGAVVTDLTGQPDFFALPYATIVANAQVHPLLLALLQQE